MSRGFVGFGFGPIQAGLFVPFARADGFDRVTIAEIDPNLVRALRASGGAYALNIAHADRLETVRLSGIEILNPFDPQDDRRLAWRLSEAVTIVTALPSPAAYVAGGGTSVAGRIAAALREPGPPVVVYTAENHPEAPARLEGAVRQRLAGVPPARETAFVGTVIGKMSQFVIGEDAARRRDLAAITPDLPRAFLVESFDRIISGRVPEVCHAGRLSRLIEADDLRPHQELKLYGHNAAHLMLGLVACGRGVPRMPRLRDLPFVLEAARGMILFESGVALRRRWPAAGGELTSDETLRLYAEELVERMINPWLDDAVARVIRDLPRKLGRDDRLFGALAVCDQHGVRAPTLEAAALGGVALWRAGASGKAGMVPPSEGAIAGALSELWKEPMDAPAIRDWAHRLFAARGRWAKWLTEGGA